MDLIGEHIKLRSFRKDDAEILTELFNNKKIWNNLRDSTPYPYTEKDADEFIGICLNEFPQVTFAIEFEGELVGGAVLNMNKDVYRFSAEIGYWVAEPYWGKGLATEAVKLLTEYGFSYLGLNRIYATVFDFNKASQKVLEKAGYELEGISRKAVFKNSKVCDEFRYAKTEEVKSESDGLLDKLL